MAENPRLRHPPAVRAHDHGVGHTIAGAEHIEIALERGVALIVSEEAVDARTAGDVVVVAAAPERVVARTAIDAVVAAVAQELVGATEARDLVVAAATGKSVRPRRADEDVG
ncbi:MAG: hypothetical protein WD624_00755, partial [Rhodospirillales bacterium]